MVFGSKSVVPSGFLRSDIDINKILKKNIQTRRRRRRRRRKKKKKEEEEEEDH